MTSELDIRRYAGLTADSRAVVRGGLFVAVAGAERDGREFIADAVEKGAVAVLTDMRDGMDEWTGKIDVIQDPEPRRLLSEAAAKFYGLRPSVAALVTGSSGKTSTVEFARQIWGAVGRKAASVGTLGVVAPGVSRYGGLTSPDPVALMATLAELASAGVDAVAVEASSHGLDQSRLFGVQAEIGVFTSFSRDHLDYHGDEAAYFQAKLKLFSEAMAPGGFAFVAAGMKEAAAARKAAVAAGHQALTYGRGGDFLTLNSARPDRLGLVLEVAHGGVSMRIRLDHFADFQAENALAAAAVAIASGADPKDAIGAIEALEQPKGRMERVAVAANGAPIFVDYSHKPGALEAAILALAKVVEGGVHVVFGCGGDRDPGKRPLMGEIAARLAKSVIVTDDNPRTEDPARIRREVLEGAPGAREIADRAEAIAAGIAALGPKDALLIAGKGHEQGQIVGRKTLPFDDGEAARAALRESAA